MKQKKGHAECDKYINIQKQNRKEKIKSPQQLQTNEGSPTQERRGPKSASIVKGICG